MAFDGQTLLILDDIGVPLYSARGLKQTLSLIDQAKQLRRTINGALDDLSQPQFQKFQSKISCTDFQAPAFDGLEIGRLVTVECVCELTYKTSGGSPSRSVVSGSSRTIGNFTAYRPVLAMRVTDFEIDCDEWNHDTGWTLSLEEI